METKARRFLKPVVFATADKESLLRRALVEESYASLRDGFKMLAPDALKKRSSFQTTQQ
jgi:hypothetical protein